MNYPADARGARRSRHPSPATGFEAWRSTPAQGDALLDAVAAIAALFESLFYDLRIKKRLALDGDGLDLIEAALGRLVSAGGRLRVLVGETDLDVLSRLRGLSAQVRRVPGGLGANSYRIHDLDGQETTFVGASPITRGGLLGQSTWNYRRIPGLDREGQREVRAAFEALWEGAVAQT